MIRRNASRHARTNTYDAVIFSWRLVSAYGLRRNINYHNNNIFMCYLSLFVGHRDVKTLRKWSYQFNVNRQKKPRSSAATIQLKECQLLVGQMIILFILFKSNYLYTILDVFSGRLHKVQMPAVRRYSRAPISLLRFFLSFCCVTHAGTTDCVAAAAAADSGTTADAEGDTTRCEMHSEQRTNNELVWWRERDADKFSPTVFTAEPNCN